MIRSSCSLDTTGGSPNYISKTKTVDNCRIRIYWNTLIGDTATKNPPSKNDVIITATGTIWKIVTDPVHQSGLGDVWDCTIMYLFGIIDEAAEEIYSRPIDLCAISTIIDNKIPVYSNSIFVTQLAIYTAAEYNAAQGGVKVIKNSIDKTINLESKIILDLSDDAVFPASTTPALSLTLPDYTHFNAGHTIEFFDAASKFDTKNVQISAAATQKINTFTNPILLDITYSTIKFIYSGDPAIGWVF